MKSFIDILQTMYIIRLWRISEGLDFIWMIPPIFSCTDYNISKSNNIIIMIHVLAFFVIYLANGTIK